MLLPLLFLAGGGAALYLALRDNEPVPHHEPDLPPMKGSTGYKRIDAILGKLKAAATAAGIPLGVLVGWIARESGGKLEEVTKLDERGLFQLMPSESQRLGLDHQRLSTDVDYSIAGGIKLIQAYMADVSALGVALAGSSYFWRLVKLCHTMGSGATRSIVAAAKAAGAARSWDSLESFALDHDKDILAATHHSPKKWFPLVDAVADVGAPFGFGDGTAIVGAEPAFNDIPDPLDCMPQPYRF